jgi:hypothetical protein
MLLRRRALCKICLNECTVTISYVHKELSPEDEGSINELLSTKLKTRQWVSECKLL